MVMDRYITMVKREHISMITDRKINWQYYYKIKKHYRILRGSALNDCDVYLKTVTICFVFYIIILGISPAFPCVVCCAIRSLIPCIAVYFPWYVSPSLPYAIPVYSSCNPRVTLYIPRVLPVRSPCGPWYLKPNFNQDPCPKNITFSLIPALNLNLGGNIKLPDTQHWPTPSLSNT